MPSIPGRAPDMRRPLPGCGFAERCAHVEDVCRRQPAPVVEVAAGHLSRCHFAGER